MMLTQTIKSNSSYRIFKDVSAENAFCNLSGAGAKIGSASILHGFYLLGMDSARFN
ncbi:hypothetical protein [Parerythrobacter lacustris]|uniref:Uncharacterized protein n=1 Tax=Parerythrobacter lacustris TaxID=2969984 RepID=A0ABT1XT04_9SPHN|nr:hypothetical protein [Parerythrobacter lacustris]MCR2834337.1 hypothetical protein [Parerythrobacter lacustris]